MPLSLGDRPGPHEILALFGARGMSEVYRAKVTEFDGAVAIKAPSG